MVVAEVAAALVATLAVAAEVTVPEGNQAGLDPEEEPGRMVMAQAVVVLLAGGEGQGWSTPRSRSGRHSADRLLRWAVGGW